MVACSRCNRETGIPKLDPGIKWHCIVLRNRKGINVACTNKEIRYCDQCPIYKKEKAAEAQTK